MTVTYTVSNNLHVTGLPPSVKDFYRTFCQYNTESFASEDTPPDLNLFKELPDGSILIPRGLESQLTSYLSSMNIQFERLENVGGEHYEFKIEPAINYTSGPFGYQGPTLEKLLSHATGRLQSPAGSGKTAMACLAAALLQEGPLLFLVQTDRLFTQFVNTVPKVLGIPKEEVGILKGSKRVVKPITCGSLRTVGGKNFNIEKYKHSFGTVFFDECHLSTALTYRNVILGLAPRRLYGLSATPEHYSSDDLNRLMDSMLGPVVVEVPPSAIPGRLTPEIYTRETGRTYNFIDTKGKPEWMVHRARHKLMDDIKNDPVRNNLIVEDCVKLINMGYKPLIAVARVDHARILTEMLKERGALISFPYKETIKKKKKGKKEVEVSSWTADHKTLNKDVQRIDEGQLHGIAGTYALFGTGFDAPILSAVLMVGPYSGRNSNLTIQVTGRAQRHYYGKNSAVIFDYTDDSSPNNVLRGWSNDRAETFLTEFGNRDIIPV